MAVLFSIQSGNFSDSSTWDIVDATSYLDSRVAAQQVTTTQTAATVAFTPGAITVSGILLQVGGRAASPTGTVTVRLFNNTTGLTVKDVVVNAADFPNTGSITSGYIGWTYFKFDADTTLVAGNQYSIRAFSSVTGTISVYRNATASNWSRGLVTTTNAAPAATDILITGGTYISAGSNTTTTVTMNSISLATQYGNIYVGSNGRFNYGVAASTNYALRIAGDIWIGQSGTFTIGTAATPMHQTSTAVLEINCASALQFQIYNFGTFETKHATTVLHRALLNADIAVGATTMTTDVTTGWRQNDVIVIPSTTRTTSQHERVTLNANASSTTLTHNATSFAHDGNAAIYMQADLANLTRSIKIRSVSASFRSRFQQGLNGVTTLFDVEFFEWAGCIHNSGTLTYAGSFNLQQCSFWGTINTSTVLSNVFTTSNTISNNVFWNYADAVQNIDDNNLIIGFTSFHAFSGSIGNNNVISSCANAGWTGTFRAVSSGNRFYATGGNGAIYSTSSITGVITASNYVFFNNSIAIRYVSSASTLSSDRTLFERFENCYFYGNVDNISMIASGGVNPVKKLWFNNCFFWAGKTGLLTAIGYSAIPNDFTHFTNCTFGRRPDSVDSLFSTSCLRGGQVGNTLTNCLLFGTEASFASTTTLSSVNGFNGITSLKHDQITNEYRQYQSNGSIENDNIITYNGLPTIRILPAVVTNKTFSNPVRVAVKSGQTCNVSVAIRRSSGSDSSPYTGNPPRLMYAFNPLAGNLTETTGVSYTNSNLIVYAQNFENAYWVKNAMNVIANDTIGPTGLLDADKLIPTAVNAEHNVIPSISPVPALGNTETFSVYAKAAGYNFLGLRVNISSVWSVSYFNLSTGVISTSSPNFISSDISDVGNGWYRCSITFANRTINGFQIMAAPTQAVTSIGNGVDGIFTWGADLEIGTLTNYVPDGTWETLSYTTPAVSHDSVLEFYVDCDGNTGWINIDDFKTTTSNDTRSMNYWSTIGVYSEPDWRRPGGTTTFVS